MMKNCCAYRSAVERPNGTASAATISLPIGHSAIPGQFQMRPGERNADNGHGKHDRGENVAERQPPACQHQPDEITDQAERPGAEIVPAGFGARYGFAAEWQ